MRQAHQQVASRNAVSPPIQNRARTQTVPAPVRGLVLVESLAKMGPGAGLIIDNFVVLQDVVRPRGGAQKYATIGSDPVRRIWNYRTGGTEKLFASDDTGIYDITSVADPAVEVTAQVTGQTSGFYSTEHMGTAGGDYLYAVNGTDEAQIYDGTSWAAVNASSTISITGISTTTFSYVFKFANRLFFVQSGTNKVWYLPVDSVGGPASDFSLAGIFKGGGSLLFGARWSLDTGDGLDDKCVFVSTTGEVAIYEGTNPASATDWRLVGLYEVSVPMGAEAHFQAGGDLVIATETGLVPLSEAVRKDIAALSLSAVSRNIEPEWNKAVSERRSAPWETLKWEANNMLIVSLPLTGATSEKLCFSANLETGAWSRFTGWDTRCLATFQNSGLFGDSAGKVFLMDVGGSDDGSPYTAVCVGAPDHLGSPSTQKLVHGVRTTFRSSSPFNPVVTVDIDYLLNDLTGLASSVADYNTNRWNEGLWDSAIFDQVAGTTTSSEWTSVGRTGFMVSPRVELTFGVLPVPRIEFVAFDFVFEAGGVMV